MKRSKFSPTQIAGILKEFELGKDAESVSRAHGISKATLYKWRQRYGGMEASELKRMKQLEAENAKLKRMYADLALELDMAKYIIEKSSNALQEKSDCERGLLQVPWRHQQGVPIAKDQQEQFELRIQEG